MYFFKEYIMHYIPYIYTHYKYVHIYRQSKSNT